jgi:hypothetical protein
MEAFVLGHDIRRRLPHSRLARLLFRLSLGAKLAFVATAASGQSLAAPVPLPVDRATTVGGMEMACTGVGETRRNTQWASFGVRIEFSNGRNEYLGGGAVRVRNLAGDRR